MLYMRLAHVCDVYFVYV